MTVGNALFARLAIRGFTRIGAEIGSAQARVASGVNDPRPSADPARAAELSALRDMRARLETRAGLASTAGDRLALADETLAGLSENVRKLKEITLRAANDTLTGDAYAALRSEALMIRSSMLAMANATDAMGRPLFAGTAGGPAFAETVDGVVYRGDDAATMTRLSERTQIATGVPGSDVFGADPTGLFAAVDDTIAALTEPMLSARPRVAGMGQARLSLVRSREPETVEVTLAGPAGTARVQLDLRLDAPEAPLAAINAQTAATGISAVMESDGRTIRLVAQGEIAVSDQSGGNPRRPNLFLETLDPQGQPTGHALGVRPAPLTASALVERAGAIVDHLALMRAKVGSLGDAVDKAAQSIAGQKLTVSIAVSGLEDLDVAATVTRLQSLLMTQQASQQTFIKISGQSLFDFLR